MRNERFHVRRLRGDPDRRRNLSGCEQLLQRASRLDGDHVGRWSVLDDVLVAREHPCHLAEIDAVLVLQDAAHPQSGRDGIAPVDAHSPAFQIFRCADARFRVVDDRAVVKGPHRKHRDRGERLPMGPRAQVRRHRQFADVELEAAHHAPEGLDDDRHVLEVELERSGSHRPVHQRLRVSTHGERGLELRLGLTRKSPRHDYARSAVIMASMYSSSFAITTISDQGRSWASVLDKSRSGAEPAPTTQPVVMTRLMLHAWPTVDAACARPPGPATRTTTSAASTSSRMLLVWPARAHAVSGDRAVRNEACAQLLSARRRTTASPVASSATTVIARGSEFGA